MTTALEVGEGSASRPGRSLPPGKTRYPLYRRLGGPQDRSGQVRKISLTPGFNSRTVQPVANHYTDWATQPTNCYVFVDKRMWSNGGMILNGENGITWRKTCSNAVSSTINPTWTSMATNPDLSNQRPGSDPVTKAVVNRYVWRS
jgi:hypothetical protein